MNSITFNNYNLQTANIVSNEIQQFETSMRTLNIQKFVTQNGGKITEQSFEPKVIILSGHLKGSSADNLEERIDDFKKELLTPVQANLDIEYRDGTRRYTATCQNVSLDRKNYTVDFIDWQAEFVVSDPPFGQSTTSSTLIDSISNSYAATATGEHTGNFTHTGTVAPYDIIRFTFNAVNGFRRMTFTVVNNNDFTTATEIDESFNDGDILEINLEKGQIKKNSTGIDFSGGFPNFTLANNTYTIDIIAKSYNIDVKFVYTPLWL